MTTNPPNLSKRTKEFALQIMRLVDLLPNTHSGRTVASQMVRSGLSVAANYRTALNGRSKAEFIAKLGTVREEADETVFWLEIIMESGLLKSDQVVTLHKKALELFAIFTTSIKTAKSTNTRGQIS